MIDPANFLILIYYKSISESSSVSNSSTTLADVNYELQRLREEDTGLTASLTDDEDLSLNDPYGDNEDIENQQITTTTEDKNNKPTSDLFWSMQRMRLGSEWQRLQLKLHMLKSKSAKCDRFLAKTNQPPEESSADSEAIRALSDSLKESVSGFSSPLLNNENSSSETDCHKSTSRCEIFKQNIDESDDLIKLGHPDGDDALLRSLYMTLMHFKQSSSVKSTCLCDSANTVTTSFGRRRRLPSKLLAKSCICCQILKTGAEKQHENVKSPIEEAKQTENVSKNAISEELRVVHADHSYCKELKYPEQLVAVTPSSLPKKHSRTKQIDANRKASLSVSAYFNGSGDEKRKRVLNNSENSRAIEDEVVIDAGMELSLEDMQNLPDFSYDELRFLCGEGGVSNSILDRDDDEDNEENNSKKQCQSDSNTCLDGSFSAARSHIYNVATETVISSENCENDAINKNKIKSKKRPILEVNGVQKQRFLSASFNSALAPKNRN
jgi:hypothetical protein